MQRMVLQVLLGISGLLMLFRFGAPALIFGATGPGPLGNRWLAEGNTATLLLDSDLRFFGAMKRQSRRFRKLLHNSPHVDAWQPKRRSHTSPKWNFLGRC